MSSLYKEAWESLRDSYATYLFEDRYSVWDILKRMEQHLEEARQRAKEYQEELEKKLDEAEDRQQKDWLEEQGD